VNESVLDVNSSVVRASYYCNVEVLDYILHVQDEVGEPINQALINITRVINGSLYTMTTLRTDGNGDVTVYLIPDQHYKIKITKTGYETEYADYTPTSNVRTKTYQLSLESIDIIDEYSFDEEISLTASMNSSGYINISYTDSLSNTTTLNLTLYENNTDTGVYWYNTTSNSFTTNTSALSINVSYQLYAVLDHVNFGNVTLFIYIPGYDMDYRDITNASRFDELFEILGSNPFGWHNFIGFMVLLGCVFSFGKRNTGLALMLSGGVFLFLEFIVGISLIGSTLGILLLVLGFLSQWRNVRSEVRY